MTAPDSNNAPVTDFKEMENYNLSVKEYEIITVKKLNERRESKDKGDQENNKRTTYELSQRNRNHKERTKQTLELKNTVKELKNPIGNFSKTLDHAERQICTQKEICFIWKF